MGTDRRPLHPQTLAVRAGLHRSWADETSAPIHMTSGFVYGNAAEAEAAFAGEVDRFVYSRNGNPTVSLFEERLRVLEGAEAVKATATGMAAVFAALACQLNQGDRVVAARGSFGPCYVVLTEILPRWGIEVELVDGTDLDAWATALARPTHVVFAETPSNPMQDLVDLVAVSDLAHAAGAVVVIDNVFATPVLQRPLTHGADVVVYSATKHIDGQGRALGGAVAGSRRFVEQELVPFLKVTGPTLSPFNAWILAKGLETLHLRVGRMAATAERVAAFLDDHPAVASVRYPWLRSHPQAGLARRQMDGGGTVVTFEVTDGTAATAHRVIDRLAVFDISNNLGDAKSLITHPATTTHRRLGPVARKEMGIGDGVVRLSIGLEHPDDLVDDLARALEAA